MILLPDIRIDGNILSIQEPFTLNGYLVTDIDIIEMEMSYHTIPSGRIRIKNETNYNVEIGFENLNYCFTREMDSFLLRYGSDAHVEGRRDRTDWSHYNFFKYTDEIKEQCRKIREAGYNYGRYSYLNALRADLRRQGRVAGEFRNLESCSIINNPFVNEFDATWYGSSVTNYLQPTFGVDINTARNACITLSNGMRGVCTVPETIREYIHKHNYKPRYIHHYMPNEKEDTTLLLGAEIEVDCGGESEEHAKNVLEIICGINPDNNSEALDDKMYCTHDGSLKNGIEFDTMPCSLAYHKYKMRYKEMFKYLDEHGYKAHDTTTCGLHIHADRKYLGKSELIQQLTISKILYILEKFNDEICVIARRGNSYSKFVGNGKDEKSIIELYGKYKNQDKHVALNLKHEKSIEFRCFKGTLKYETFILTLEFVQNIIDYAKSINIEEIEKMRWSDLMDTFSDGLKEYYNERLEKEKQNKKKEEEKKESITTTWRVDSINLNNTTIDTGRLYINDGDCIRSIASLNSIEPEPIYADIDTDWSRAGRNLFNNSIGTISAEIESSARGFWENLVITNNGWNIINSNSSTKSEEEKLKDKINSLKKKIKNSNNFMEKKNLQKELNETQKELKKEKKKNRLNNNTER